MLPILRQTTPSITLFDSLFDDFFTIPGWDIGEKRIIGIRNPVHDIIENDKEYVVELSLAGVKKENVSLNLEDDVLTIKAERKEADDKKYNRKQTYYGKYEKSFTLPETIDKDNIVASFEDGILKISIPKTEQRAKISKQIEIK